MQDTAAEPDLKTTIERLMRAIGSGLPRDVAKHYAVIHEFGDPAIDELGRILNKADWRETESPGKLKILGTLMNLIHDIDEDRSALVSNQIMRKGCHPAVAQRLKSIRGHFRANFHRYEIRGVPIYESRGIKSSRDIRLQLARWMAIVPAPDLEAIRRMYLIPRDESQDYVGLYRPFFAVITLVWHEPVPDSDWLSRLILNRLVSWTALIRVEKTLYHEIGHHVHRHSGGPDLDHEREADRYAAQLMRRKHWGLVIAVFPFFMFSRGYRWARRAALK